MSTKKLVTAAVIASVYAVVTIAIAPFSYGLMQIRISEALTILPMFTSAAIPGLFVGCLLANIISPIGIVDMLLGSLATLLAAYGSYKLKNHKWLVPLPPILVNGLVIGWMLYYVYGVDVSLLACMLWVAGGEAIACYGLGMPLIIALNKRKEIFK